MTGSMRPTAENWSCGYEPEPKNWVCAESATQHGFRLTDDGSAIAGMMASCDAHRPRMAAHADYIHDMASICGLPGSQFAWPENICFTDWDLNALAQESQMVFDDSGG